MIHSNELEYTKQLKAKLKDKIKISDYIHISNSPYPKLFKNTKQAIEGWVHIIILLKIIIEEIYNENKNLYSFNFNNYDNECCHILQFVAFHTNHFLQHYTMYQLLTPEITIRSRQCNLMYIV